MMKIKQTIAIIGATGKMGSAISKAISAGNYRLLLKSSKRNELDELVQEIRNNNVSADVEAIACPTEACWEADIIVLAIPYEAEKIIAEKIKEVANQKIIISISRPLNKGYDEQLIGPATSAAEELQEFLPNSKLVKAFNKISAADLTTTEIDGKQADVFIAGNDEEALETVKEIVITAGYHPVITGSFGSKNPETMRL